MACRIAVHRKETGDTVMEILRTENLKKIYKTLSGEVRALDGVSLSVEEGEFAAIAGSSGSGKTTLLICWAVWTILPADRSLSGEKLWEK